MSLTDILNTSFLKFGDTIYCKTRSNTFVPICDFDKPISSTQCFVETNDIVIDPIPEYFNDNISSLYIYHFSTEIDFSSEKYSGSTGHRNSWYQ